MRSQRGATELAGIVILDKPAGLTSHDVVNALRAATGERRIGHAGTLDPMATGLLLVLIGRATRLERYLVGHDKGYEARIVFGSSTDTLDAEGRITDVGDIPPAVLDPERARELLRGFVGAQQQMPPAYSAVKRGGVAAHRLAREGKVPDLEPRQIVVHEAQLTEIHSETHAWSVRFEVSKGTYVRSLAADIGRAAGTVAHLGALRRTRIGSACLSAATSLAGAVAAAEAGRLSSLMADPVPLLGMPVLEIDPSLVRDGRRVPAPEGAFSDGECVALVADNLLLGVYRCGRDILIPESVLVPGIAR